MSVTGNPYDKKTGVIRVTLTSLPQLHPLSESPTAAKNYYCLSIDTKGFQVQIDLQALPPGVTLQQLQPNQVWWVEKRTTLYRLYLYAGVLNTKTNQVVSTAVLPNNIVTSPIVNGYVSYLAPSGTQNIYVTTNGTTIIYEKNATNSFTFNITSTTSSTVGGQTIPGETLNNLLVSGQTMPINIWVKQGASGASFYCTGLHIDGAAQNVYWQGGTAPASGNANGVDLYTFTIAKTGDKSYTTLGSLTKF